MRQDCITPEVNGALTHIAYLCGVHNNNNAYNNRIIIIIIISITFKASHYNRIIPIMIMHVIIIVMYMSVCHTNYRVVHCRWTLQTLGLMR